MHQVRPLQEHSPRQGASALLILGTRNRKPVRPVPAGQRPDNGQKERQAGPPFSWSPDEEAGATPRSLRCISCEVVTCASRGDNIDGQFKSRRSASRRASRSPTNTARYGGTSVYRRGRVGESRRGVPTILILLMTRPVGDGARETLALPRSFAVLRPLH